jgi:arylsulfatase A-like enzyme
MERREAFDEGGASVPIQRRIGESLERIHPSLHTAASNLRQFLSGSDEEATQYREQPDEVVRNFEDFVRGSTPFYSFVHLMDTHTPYVADPERVQSYLAEFDYRTDVPMRGTGRHPASFDRLIERSASAELRDKYYLPDGTPTTAITDAHYDAAVTQADERVGRLIDVLKEHDLYENTLIVFLSDHGESLTEHGIYYDHHGLYDVSTHVPLIVRPPNGDHREITEFVQITDIAPTVESYADSRGLEPDGYSLRPLIEDDATLDRQYVIAEEAHTQRRRMVRSERSKLIYSLDGETVCRYCDVQHAPAVEFYDLIADPAETENLAEDREDDVTELREYGDSVAEEFTTQRPNADADSEVTYDDEGEVEERLEALGYR